jgi:hypothetical protein
MVLMVFRSSGATAAVDQRLKHLVHVPADLEDRFRLYSI